MNEPNISVGQGQLSDPDFISGTYQRENVKFGDKSHDRGSYFQHKGHIYCSIYFFLSDQRMKFKKKSMKNRSESPVLFFTEVLFKG